MNMMDPALASGVLLDRPLTGRIGSTDRHPIPQFVSAVQLIGTAQVLMLDFKIHLNDETDNQPVARIAMPWDIVPHFINDLGGMYTKSLPDRIRYGRMFLEALEQQAAAEGIELPPEQ